MGIYNLNPRRVVWFSPNEPSNKYDIWLSRNAHLDKNGEPTTDSNSQRDCDYIFKIYDCGQWNPIVGFNSTTAHKIDTVKDVTYSTTHNGQTITSTGYSEFHVPLFTNPSHSPSELFDGGSVGEVILEYVSEEDWVNIFEGDAFTNAFNTSVIGGDNYNWEVLINQLIDSGDIEIPLATYQKKGGARIQTDTTSQDYRGVPVLFGGPRVGLTYGGNTPPGFTLYGDSLTYNSDNSFLYIPGWALNDWLQDPTGQGTTLPFPIDPGSIVIALDTVLKNTSSIGWSILSTASNPSISPEIYGINRSAAGRYLRIKPDFTGGIPEGGWNQSNCAVEWVDLPEGIEYSAGTGITISQQNEISIDTTGASTNQVLTKTEDGIGWTTPQQTTYTAGAGIDVTGTTISGLIRLDEESTTATSSVVIDTMSITQSFPKGGCRINIDGDSQGGVQPYHYKIINFRPEKNSTLEFNVLNSITYLKGDPVYFKINIDSQTEPSDIIVSFGNNGEYIIHNEALVVNNTIYTFNPKFYKYLVTIQFGIVEIKPIRTNSSSN